MRALFFKNLGLKALSLGVAVLVWFLVAGERASERVVRAPIEFQNMPRDLEPVGEVLSSVEARVRGSSGALGQLGSADVLAVVNLAGTRPGRRIFHLGPEEVRAPFGVRVVSVSPASIEVALDRTATRMLPVEPPIQGNAAPGFAVGRITIEPESVHAAGPESRLRNATAAFTEPIDISGARATVHESVNIGLPDSSLRLLGPRKAEVTIVIKPER